MCSVLNKICSNSQCICTVETLAVNNDLASQTAKVAIYFHIAVSRNVNFAKKQIMALWG